MAVNSFIAHSLLTLIQSSFEFQGSLNKIKLQIIQKNNCFIKILCLISVIRASTFLKKIVVRMSCYSEHSSIKAMKKYRNVQNLFMQGIRYTRGFKHLFRDLRVLTYCESTSRDALEWNRVFGSIAHLKCLAFEELTLKAPVIFETATKINNLQLTEFKLDRVIVKSQVKESIVKFLKTQTSIRKLVIKVLKDFDEIWALLQDMIHLKCFEFSWNVISLEAIQKVNGVNLNVLDVTIAGIDERANDVEALIKFEEIIKRFPRLTRFVLLPRIYPTNEKIQLIAKHLLFLQDLSLVRWGESKDLKFEGSFPNLQRLSIEHWDLQDQKIDDLKVCYTLLPNLVSI